jgi:hypothetical protein
MAARVDRVALARRDTLGPRQTALSRDAFVPAHRHLLCTTDAHARVPTRRFNVPCALVTELDRTTVQRVLQQMCLHDFFDTLVRFLITIIIEGFTPDRLFALQRGTTTPLDAPVSCCCLPERQGGVS